MDGFEVDERVVGDAELLDGVELEVTGPVLELLDGVADDVELDPAELVLDGVDADDPGELELELDTAGVD